MRFPSARITDMHVCPLVGPGPVPHVGGPVTTGFATVLVGKIPAARIGDMATCVGPPDTIVSGSTTVLIGNSPAARITDSTGHGGKIVAGLPTVLIGTKGGGGGSAAAGGGGGTRATPSGGPIAGLSRQANALLQGQEDGMPFCEVCNSK